MSVGKSILVIDDSEAIRYYFDTVLSEHGYPVALAGSADEGLKKIKQKQPDLIILDVDLPDLDGRQFCKLLKSDPDLRYIPVLMCTGHKTTEEKVAGLKIGADDYIAKPFDQAELLERINALFRRAELAEEQAHEKFATAQRASQSPAVSPALAAAQPLSLQPMQSMPVSPRSAPAPAPPPMANETPAAAVEDMDASLAGSMARGASLRMARLKQALLLIWSMLAQPSETLARFEGIPMPASLAPLLLMSVCQGLAAFCGSPSGSALGLLAVVLAPPLLWGTMTGLTFAVLRGRQPDWGKIARLCSLSACPLALSGGLCLVYVLITEGSRLEFSASPLSLLGRAAPSSSAGLLMDRFDVFELWAAALLALGCSRVLGLPKKRSLFLAGAAWLLLSLGRLASRFVSLTG